VCLRSFRRRAPSGQIFDLLETCEGCDMLRQHTVDSKGRRWAKIAGTPSELAIRAYFDTMALDTRLTFEGQHGLRKQSSRVFGVTR
jgi:hypothetical protein